MPLYTELKELEPDKKIRIANGILSLKEGMSKENIPEKSYDKLLLATWNIREFDSSRFGKRLDESMYYIAEIIDRFDLVALQELRDDLDGLRRLMKLLGKHWKIIFTDVSGGREGNYERLAYLYDSRKVEFGGLAGELVLPLEKKTKLPQKQWARTPFAVGFKVGWYRFIMVSVHLIYGKSGANSPERIKEAEILSEFLAEWADNKTAWSENIILLGDFNIFRTNTKTFEAIAEHFRIPDEIMELPSNIKKDKHFDQISFRTPYLNDLIGIKSGMKAGVFNFFDYVFTEDQETDYVDVMGESYANSSNQSNYYKTHFRTHQLSDHLPMWIEFPIDRSQLFLKDMASGIFIKSTDKNPNEQIADDF